MFYILTRDTYLHILTNREQVYRLAILVSVNKKQIGEHHP